MRKDDNSGDNTIHRTTIINFDSQRQITSWQELMKNLFHPETKDDLNTMLAEELNMEEHELRPQRLWTSDDLCSRCERLVNLNTSFATHFAGIARTAFLYCDTIVMTVPQIFDGIFFQALGPTRINNILSRSYKDHPSILISGMYDTLEESILHFALRKIENTEQWTLRIMDYSALGIVFTEQNLAQLPEDFNRRLTVALETATNVSEVCWVITQAICEAGKATKQLDRNSNLDFFGRRWQEWVQMEERGLVRYENQRNFKRETDEPCFGKRFEQLYCSSEQYLYEYLEQQKPEQDEYERGSADVRKLIDNLVSKPKRSAGFLIIDDFIERHTELKRVGESIRDYYNYVYLVTMGRHLHAQSISVEACANSLEQFIGSKLKENGDSLVLSGEITKQLGQMPYTRFAAFCFDNRTAIREWRECGLQTAPRRQRIRTHNIAYAVNQAFEEDILEDKKKSLRWSFIIAAALTIISQILTDTVISSLASYSVAISICCAVVIALCPQFIDMVQWMTRVRSASNTVVFLG